AALPDRDDAGAEGDGDRCRQEEATCLDPGDLRDRGLVERLGETFDERREKATVVEQTPDVGVPVDPLEALEQLSTESHGSSYRNAGRNRRTRRSSAGR